MYSIFGHIKGESKLCGAACCNEAFGVDKTANEYCMTSPDKDLSKSKSGGNTATAGATAAVAIDSITGGVIADILSLIHI